VIKLSLLGRLGKTCPPEGFFQVQRITRGIFFVQVSYRVVLRVQGFSMRLVQRFFFNI
jgi:hypothetical protein